jgi:hypothetical protein
MIFRNERKLVILKRTLSKTKRRNETKKGTRKKDMKQGEREINL